MDRRLVREGAVLREVNHPHVVELHTAGSLGGVPYVATRLLEGGSLADRLAESPHGLAPQEAVRVVTHVAAGLEATHRAGWVHRDVKASNILYDPDHERWVLGDFGIAQPVGEHEFERLTQPGMCIGTVTHMAPELLDAINTGGDGVAKPASDVYALTVLTFQLLTGRLPLNPLADAELIALHQLYGEMPTLTAAHPLLAGFDKVLAQGWAKDPGRRHPTASAFAADLTAALAAALGADSADATAVVGPASKPDDPTTTPAGAGSLHRPGRPPRNPKPDTAQARTPPQPQQPPRWAMTSPPSPRDGVPRRSPSRSARLRRWFEEALAGALVARDLNPQR